MTLKNKEKLKYKIIEHIAILKEEILDLKEKIQPISPENSLGRLTRLEAMGEKSINEAMLLKCEQRMKKLLFVKDRVDLDEYGLCNICDEEINIKRLEILPESTVCIECANELER